MPSIYIVSLLNRSTLTYVVATIAAIATSAGSLASAIRPHA